MDQLPPSFPPPPSPDQRGTGHYPLDVNRVLELTFSLFRFKPRTFLAAALLVMVPVSFLLAIASLLTANATNEWLAQVQGVALGRPFDLNAFPWTAIGIGLAIGAVVAIGTYVGTVALTHLALQTYGGAETDAWAAVRYSLRRWLSITALYLMIFLASFVIAVLGIAIAVTLFLTSAIGGRITPGLGVFVGLVVFVAIFAILIFISVRWALAVPALVTENLGAPSALGRSWRLVSGSSWRVLGYMLIFGLIFGLIEFLLTVVLSVLVDPNSLSPLSSQTAIDPVRVAILNFGTGLISALLMPFPAIGMTLLYLDLRWRRGETIPEPGVGVPAAQAVNNPPVANNPPA